MEHSFQKGIYESRVATYCETKGIDREEYDKMLDAAKRDDPKSYPEPEYSNPEHSDELRLDIYIQHRDEPDHIFNSPSMNDEMKIKESCYPSLIYGHESLKEERAAYEERVEDYCVRNGIDREEYDKMVSNTKDVKQLPVPEYRNPERTDEERISVYEHYRDRADYLWNSPRMNDAIKEREIGHSSSLYSRESLKEERAAYEERVKDYCYYKGIDREEYNRMVSDARSVKELPEAEYKNPERTQEERLSIYDHYRNDPYRIFNSPSMERFLEKEREQEREYKEKVQIYCREHNITERVYNLSIEYSHENALPEPERYNPERSKSERERIAREEDPRLEYEKKREDYMREHNMTKDEYKEIIYRAMEEKDPSLMPASEALNPSRSIEERKIIFQEEKDRYMGADREDYDRYNPSLSKEERSECDRVIQEREEYTQKREDYMKERDMTFEKYSNLVIAGIEDKNLSLYPLPELLNPNISREDRIVMYEQQKDFLDRAGVNPTVYERFNPSLSKQERDEQEVKFQERKEYHERRDSYCEEHNITHAQYEERLVFALEKGDYSLIPAPEALNPERNMQERVTIYEQQRDFCRNIGVDERIHESYNPSSSRFERNLSYWNIDNKDSEKYVERTSERWSDEHLREEIERFNRERNRAEISRQADALLERFSNMNAERERMMNEKETNELQKEYERSKLEYLRENNLTRNEYDRMVQNSQSSRDLPICETLNPSRKIEERMDIYQHASRDDKYIERYDPSKTSIERQEVRNEQMRETYGEHSRFNFRGYGIKQIDPDKKYDERVTEYCKEKGIDKEEYDRIVSEARYIKDLPTAEYENPNRSDFERLQIYESLTYRDGEKDIVISPTFEYVLREVNGLNPPLLDREYAIHLMDERAHYVQAIERECKEEHITREEYARGLSEARYSGELSREVEQHNPIRRDNEREFIAQGRDDKYLAPELRETIGRITIVRNIGEIEIGRTIERQEEKPEHDRSGREINEIMKALYDKNVEKYCDEHSITRGEYEQQVQQARDEGRSLIGFYPEESNPTITKEERDKLIDERISNEEHEKKELDKDRDEHAHSDPKR